MAATFCQTVGWEIFPSCRLLLIKGVKLPFAQPLVPFQFPEPLKILYSFQVKKKV